MDLVTALKPVTGSSEGPLAGSSFCVTGVFSRKRDDLHADIRARGGTVHDSVKKTTQYLVAGEKVGKSKLDKARKFGVQVISEAELQALCNPTDSASDLDADPESPP